MLIKKSEFAQFPEQQQKYEFGTLTYNNQYYATNEYIL